MNNICFLKQIKHKKEVIKLLKIRNPWGEKEKTETYSNDGEWKGCWSYASTEWKEVEESLREQHNVHINKGGECWVCMEDFCKLFGQLYIGDRIPHFDRDGFRKEDGLGYFSSIHSLCIQVRIYSLTYETLKWYKLAISHLLNSTRF